MAAPTKTKQLWSLRRCPTCGGNIQWFPSLGRFIAHFDLRTKKWCTDPKAQVRI